MPVGCCIIIVLFLVSLMSTRCACWMLYYYCSVSSVFDEYKMCLLDAVLLLPCFSVFDEYKMCLLDAVLLLFCF